MTDPLDTDAPAARRTVLRASGVRVLSWRFRGASWLLGCASALLRHPIVLVEDEPPAQTHDVAVEKHGELMKLRIDDAGVLLTREDARHIGSLLESRWVGTLRDCKAADGPTDRRAQRIA